MSGAPKLLAIDQGTTSSRAMVFHPDGAVVSAAHAEFPQIYPRNGWVEHDPAAIWSTTLEVTRRALADAGGAIDAIGITNQRETTLVWERASGAPIANAIVWQDRRTAERCRELREEGWEARIGERTGLVIDPYFSATKLAWILDNVEGARERARRGELAFGTVDAFLVWRLTGGKVHATDATNASRTMLYDIGRQRWDEEILERLDIPAALLPEVRDSAGDYGHSDPDVLGRRLPIRAVAGDQQAATVGQACFAPGMVKSTYGTGCFLLMNTGEQPIRSRSRLLTTIAYRIGGRTTYALEGAIFIAGAAVQWLRDGLGIIASAAESEGLARQRPSSRGVYLVPAFTGLGAPHWDPAARGAIFGLTRDSDRGDLCRAALEAVAYQTRDLIEAMREDGAVLPETVRVDGGMVVNDWLVQFLADQLGCEVDRPVIGETTALGAAYLAGLACGVYASLDDIARRWRRDRRFTPAIDEETRAALYRGWQDAVRRTLAAD